jgi:hypothetical protein
MIAKNSDVNNRKTMLPPVYPKGMKNGFEIFL